MEGANADGPPASKVRAIQGRSVLPRAISTVVTLGGGAGGRVAVGVLVGVQVGVGEAVAVNVGEGAGLGVLVKVAVGRGEGVGVGGSKLETIGRSLIEGNWQDVASNSEDSKTNSKPLLVLKLQPPLNGADDVAIGQIQIQVIPWAPRSSIIAVSANEFRRNRVFVA